MWTDFVPIVTATAAIPPEVHCTDADNDGDNNNPFYTSEPTTRPRKRVRYAFSITQPSEPSTNMSSSRPTPPSSPQHQVGAGIQNGVPLSPPHVTQGSVDPSSRYPSPPPTGYSTPSTVMIGSPASPTTVVANGQRPRSSQMQSLEAQLTIPPFNPNGRHTRKDSQPQPQPQPQPQQQPNPINSYASHQQQQALTSNQIPRLPATHQTTHRPASTTVVPVTAQRPQAHQQQSYNGQQVMAQQAYDAYGGIVPVGAGAGGYGDQRHNSTRHQRASHHVVPVSSSSNSSAAAAAAAYQSSSNLHHHITNQRQKVYFGPYLLLQTLGEGEFGKVKLGIYQHPDSDPARLSEKERSQRASWGEGGVSRWGEEVAIKLIKRGNIEESSARKNKVRREIEVLEMIKHPNIVRLYDVIETDKYIGIVLEYASGGELFDHILAHRYLKEKDACRLFAQLISGVSYLHAKKIVHRDLKLENILLDRNRNIIVTDFGFANRFEDSKSDLMATSCGSPCYAAPELVLQEGKYVGSAVDVWSCGVILYAMLAGYLPFDDDPSNPEGDNIPQLYKYIINTPLSFPDWITPEPRDLLLRMLVPDPLRRCNVEDIGRHRWLRQYASIFDRTVDELEQMAIEQETNKRVMLARQRQMIAQEQAQKRREQQMSRSQSSRGGGQYSTQHQVSSRHQSARVEMVPSTTSPNLSYAAYPQSPPVGQNNVAPASAATSVPKRAHAHSAIVVPVTQPQTFGGAVGDAFSYGSTPPVPNVLATNSTPSKNLESTSGNEGISDEGERRGEPRGRRQGDSSDAATTPTRNKTKPAAAAVPVPAQVPGADGEAARKRKAQAHRYTVQVEYDGSASERSAKGSKTSSAGASPNLEGAASEEAPALPRGPSVIEAATKSEREMMEEDMTKGVSVGMETKTQEDVEMVDAAPSTSEIASSPVDGVPPVPLQSVAETKAADGIANSAAEPMQEDPRSSTPVSALPPVPPLPRTPTNIRSSSLSNMAPPPPSAGSRRSPKSSTGQSSVTSIPFPPSPERKNETTPRSKISRADSVESGQNDTPTSSAKSKNRHRKGMSTDKFFFARILGSAGSGTNLEKQAKRSSRAMASNSSLSQEVNDETNSTEDGTEENEAPPQEGSNWRKGSRRKAMSLVVEPIGKASAAVTRAKKSSRQESTRAQDQARQRSNTMTSTASRASRVSVRAANNVTTSSPSTNSMALANNNKPPPNTSQPQPVATSQLPEASLPPFQINENAWQGSTSSSTSKAKRVMDWFRFKSLAKEPGNFLFDQPLPINTDFDCTTTDEAESPASTFGAGPRRTPTVVVTGASADEGRLGDASVPSSRSASGAQSHLSETTDASHGTHGTAATTVTNAASIKSDVAAASDLTVMPLPADLKLRDHHGAVDSSAVSSLPPHVIIERLRQVLWELGLDVVKESDSRLKATRKGRKKVMPSVSSPMTSMPSSGSTFKSFFGRKASGQSVSALTFASPDLPSPSLTASSVANPMETAATSANMSPASSSQGHNGSANGNIPVQRPQPPPFFGDAASQDSGEEVKLCLELTRLKNLFGVYCVDIRRMKGQLWAYKAIYCAILERVELSDRPTPRA